MAAPVSARAAASLHRRLLAWFRRAARDLPWRRTRDPYAIWVSEIMLQQTQVVTATPYYRQFLRRFPSPRRLAAAPLNEVLAAWAGLGYYRRARMLHEAAVAVVREHGGRVPSDPAAFGRLPGVGRYTAGAVQSIAFGHPLPVLDGNVARVLSRLFGLPVSVRTPAGARTLWSLAESLVPMREPGDWNQALMELGATVCLPRGPRCDVCPVARSCRALKEGRVNDLPPVAARRATVRVRRAIALVTWRGRVLVERLSGPLLDGLWEPPGVELQDGEEAGSALEARLRMLGVRARLADTGERLRHTITHRRIEVEVWGGSARDGARRRADRRYVPRGASVLPMTALGARALEVRDGQVS
ncbi:MAG: A/G-specific adenine glycosylase [Candidatus Eisenbacteria bacterium]